LAVIGAARAGRRVASAVWAVATPSRASANVAHAVAGHLVILIRRNTRARTARLAQTAHADLNSVAENAVAASRGTQSIGNRRVLADSSAKTVARADVDKAPIGGTRVAVIALIIE
jgi:hypothetical protein